MGLNIKQFAGAFAPKSGLTNGLEDLPDGEYEWEYGAVSTRDVKDGCVIKAECTVVGGAQDGSKFHQEWWINTQEKADQFGNDLKKLGFDCENWNSDHDRSFEDEAGKALKVLPGMRAKGNKKTNKSKDNRVFHNLYVKSRGGDDGKPAVIGAEYLDAATEDAFG